MPEIAEREANGGSVDAGSSFVAFLKGGALCPGVGQRRSSAGETAGGEVTPSGVLTPPVWPCARAVRADEMLPFTPS